VFNCDLSLYFCIDVLTYLATELQECLINLLTYLMIYMKLVDAASLHLDHKLHDVTVSLTASHGSVTCDAMRRT